MSLLINIDVPDLEEGIRFYTEAFNLMIGRRFGPDFVELLGFPLPMYLILKKPGTVVSSMSKDLRHYDRHWTPVHLDVVVNSIEDALSKAQAAGCNTEGEIRQAPYGRLVLASDPFGNGFCLIEFQGKGYDAIAVE